MPTIKFSRLTLASIATFSTCFMVSPALASDSHNQDEDKIGIQVGASVIAGNNAYDTDGTEIRVLPSLIYDNGKVYARGSQIGGYVLSDDVNEVSVFLQPGGYEFDPEDANGALKGLDEREISGLAGVSYVRRTPIGGFRARLATDVLDNSGGTVARLAYLARYQNNKLTVYPSVGIEWVNDTYNDYYFGVSDEESNKTGVAKYEAKSSVSPYVNVNATYDLNSDWSLILGQNVAYLSDEQYDSPMVKDRLTYRTMLGANYKF